MAKRANQKVKVLYLYKIMREKTDKEHGLSLAMIQEELKKYNIEADRRVLYEDFDALRDFGADIQKVGKWSANQILHGQ